MKLKDVPEDMKTRIKRMLNSVWQYIGSDIMQTIQECEGKDFIKRSDVIELVMDADRPVNFGGDKEAVLVFNSLSITDQKKIAKEAFPYKTYC